MYLYGHRYTETNVMHFLFNLLTIMGLCMFWTLLAHPQEALNKRHLVYCMRKMSVGCTKINPGAAVYQVLLVMCLLRMSK
jgi:hypothetical protein